MMGAVWALLICVLTSWLTKGFCMPVGGTNETNQIDGLKRWIGGLEWFPDNLSIKKALGLIQSVETLLKESAKEVLLEINEVEAEALVQAAAGGNVTLDEAAAVGNVTLDEAAAGGNVTLDEAAAGGNVTLDEAAAGGNVTLDEAAAGGNVTLDEAAAGGNVTLDEAAAGGNVTLDEAAAGGNVTLAEAATGKVRIKRSTEPVDEATEGKYFKAAAAVRGGSEDAVGFGNLGLTPLHQHQVPSQ